MARDYYEILDVSRDADADVLKKAYRKLAMKYHPDRNPGDKEAERQFKEAGEAYDILKDPQKRAAYDRLGHAAFTGGGGHGGFGGGAGAGGDFSDIFGDFFSEFMGGGGRGRGGSGPREGSDLRYDMQISLEEAFKGVKRDITFTSHVSCGDCSGSGAEPGSQPQTCTQCGGMGKVGVRQAFLVIEQTCPACGGAGSIIKNPCGGCRGEGRKRAERTLAVTVPAGVESGSRIRLSGEGEAGARGAGDGDLYIFVSVKEHEFFRRDGRNIHCDAHIKMTSAALGGEFETPVIDGGRAKVTVAPGTQSGEKMRLRGKGMTILNSGGRRGDMFVHVHVETPQKLTRKQKELLEEFDREEREGCSPRAESFFDKVKDFWNELTD